MAITIDSTSAQTSVSASSSVLGNVITLVPRLTVNEAESPTWTNICAKVSGVLGLTPEFKFTQTGGRWTWDANEKGFFSYDGLVWTEMGLSPVISGGFITCQHSSAFTGDDVWFARDRREGVAQTTAWLEGLAAAYPNLIRQLPGATDFVIDTFSAQTGEDARVIAATPLLGCLVSKGGGIGKKRIGLTSGCHAGEDLGNTVYRYAVDYLLSSATGNTLLDSLDFLLLPLLNPPGREGGHTRSQFEVTDVTHNDLNRHFTEITNLFETITKNKTVCEREFSGGSVVGFIDYHSQSDSITSASAPQGYYTGNDCPLDASWIAKYQARASLGIYGAATGLGIIGWMIDAKPTVLLAEVIEQNQHTSKTNATLQAEGIVGIEVLNDMLQAGDFGTAAQLTVANSIFARGG